MRAPLGPNALVELNQELLGLVRAGLPIEQGLAYVARQARSGALRQAVERVHAAVERGSSLSDALAAEGGAFPQSYVNIVRAGERMGSLNEVLDHLLKHYRRQMRLRDAVRTAATYPLTVVWLAITVLLVTLACLEPNMIVTYKDLGAETPASTAFVMKVSSFVTAFWPFLAVILGAGLVWTIHFLFKGDVGRRDWAVLRYIPPFDTHYRHMNAMTFLATAGVLLRRGVALPEAFGLAGAALPSAAARADVAEAQQAAERGSPLGEMADRLHFLPPVSRLMLRSAQPGAGLGETMEDLAEYYAQRIETVNEGVMRIVEPVLLLFVGAAVGFVIISLWLPLFNIGKAIR
jgi:type II secretory pathway component PulF